MKRAVYCAIVISLLAATQGLAIKQTATESYLNIIEPQGGIYYFGQKLLPNNPFWTLVIGTGDITVEAEASENVVTVYFTLYNVQERDIIDQCLDHTPSNGFSCTFTNLPWGAFMLIAVGLATDFDDPIASDWRIPIVIIPI